MLDRPCEGIIGASGEAVTSEKWGAGLSMSSGQVRELAGRFPVFGMMGE